MTIEPVAGTIEIELGGKIFTAIVSDGLITIGILVIIQNLLQQFRHLHKEASQDNHY